MSENDKSRRKDRSKSKERTPKEKRDRERSGAKSHSSSKENRYKEDSAERHRRSSHDREENKPSHITNERGSSSEHRKSSHRRREENHSLDEKREKTSSENAKEGHSKQRSSHHSSRGQTRESKTLLMNEIKMPLEQKRRPPSSTKRPESALKPAVAQPPPPSAQSQGEYVYEDDFEEYSDDFEEDTEGDEEAPPITQKPTGDDLDSKGAPKKDIEEGLLQKYDESPMMNRILKRFEVVEPWSIKAAGKKVSESLRITSAQRKIDFSNATATDFDALSEVSKRYEMLKNLVGMELAFIDFLDLAPVRDYDFYMQMFGDGNHMQIQTQTGEDDLHREVQTEEMDFEIKWTQYPPTDQLGWGSALAPNALKTVDVNEEDCELALYKTNHMQSKRLRKFVAVAAQVIIELVSVPNVEKELSSMRNRSNMTFSAGYNVFSLEKLARASKVTSVLHNENRLLAAFFVKESLAEDIVNKSLLVEFRCGEPKPPERVMQCEGEVRCCCYSPDGSSAVFVGLADGSCLAFDLQEASSAFQSTLPWPESSNEYCLRTASYDTSFRSIAWKPGMNEEEEAPIVGIHATGDAQNDSTQSYQVVSINQIGTISVWTIIDGSSTSIDVDLGLRPGATLKMNETEVLKPDKVIMNNSMGQPRLIVNTMQPNPLDESQFLIGTDAGFILNVVRMKGITFSGPRIYKADIDVAAEVLCQKFSPFDQSIILAGLSNGHVSLYKLNRREAMLVLIPPNSSRKPVTHVEFSPRSQSVFYSIHDGIRLLVWDIATGKSPIAVCDLKIELQAIVLSTSIWSQKTRHCNDETTLPFLALGLSDGQLQVHALERISRSQSHCSVTELIEILNHKL